MQTVGVMSMQRIFNYGSTLQAYSLKRLIESVQPEAQVTFLDYKAGTPLVQGSSPAGKVARSLQKLREYYEVDVALRDKVRFFNHKRTYGSKNFPEIGIPVAPNYNLDVDVQIIGSDEVFNCVQSNTNVGYSRDLFGSRSPAQRVASYAGSFGNTTMAKIESAGLREELSESFSRFSSISVRDQNSANIIQTLVGQAPEVHLDPTLAFDLIGAESRIPAGRQYQEKYIIVYGYSGRIQPAENNAIRSFANRIGARVLAFGGLQASADEFIDCDPFTLLAYFRDAEAVITDTFPGTIFSIINEVPFATLIRPSSAQSYGNEEKLGHLLQKLALKGRILSYADELENLLVKPIDFSFTREVRAKEQLRSRDYLRRVLGVTA